MSTTRVNTIYRFNPYTANGESPFVILRQQQHVPPPQSSSSLLVCRPPSPIAVGTDTESMISHEEETERNSSFPSSVSSGPLSATSGITPPLAHFTPSSSSTTMMMMPPLAHLVPGVPRSSSFASSPMQCRFVPNQQQQAASPIGQYRDMKGNVHQKLNNSTLLTYVTYDKIHKTNTSSSNGGPTIRLFVGQVLHEVGALQLTNLFALLCDVTVIRCEPHGPGCFFIEIPASQFRAARQINGRVLFDVKGMWVAEGSDAAKELHDYMASVKKELKTARLPRSALVVRK